NRLEMSRCRLDSTIDRPLEPLDPLVLVIDFHDVVDQGGVLLGVRHLQPSHPLPPRRSPRSTALARALAVAQQVLAQPMPSSQLVLFGRFACSNQVPQRLVLRIRNPDRTQIAAAVRASELL